MYSWAYDSFTSKWVVLIGDVVIFAGTYEQITEYLKEKNVETVPYKSMALS